jgi:hypothetical protein
MYSGKIAVPPGGGGIREMRKLLVLGSEKKIRILLSNITAIKNKFS